MPVVSTVDLATSLRTMSGDEAFSFLVRVTYPLDWTQLPAQVPLTDGGRLRFDKRRRRAVIGHVGGGMTEIDLGRPDRMRSRGAIFSADLVRQDGPTLEISNKFDFDAELGEVALRDPLTPRIPRGTEFSRIGTRGTYRLVDAEGKPQVVGFGDADAVTGFGTFVVQGGASYGHLHTTSGLGCFYDSPRNAFMKAITDEVFEQARSEGFAPVATRLGQIGVVFDCGAPGNYLALAAYGGPHGGTIGTVVDLRRPPVRDGAIVDP